MLTPTPIPAFAPAESDDAGFGLGVVVGCTLLLEVRTEDVAAAAKVDDDCALLVAPTFFKYSAVEFLVPHTSLIVQSACPVALFGLACMHCTNVCWHMKYGKLCKKAVTSGVVPLKQTQAYVSAV